MGAKNRNSHNSKVTHTDRVQSRYFSRYSISSKKKIVFFDDTTELHWLRFLLSERVDVRHIFRVREMIHICRLTWAPNNLTIVQAAKKQPNNSDASSIDFLPKFGFKLAKRRKIKSGSGKSKATEHQLLAVRKRF